MVPTYNQKTWETSRSMYRFERYEACNPVIKEMTTTLKSEDLKCQKAL